MWILGIEDGLCRYDTKETKNMTLTSKSFETNWKAIICARENGGLAQGGSAGDGQTRGIFGRYNQQTDTVRKREMLSSIEGFWLGQLEV